MLFADREAAARLLAHKLAKYRGLNPLILAIPRGAVPMGRILADELQGELDVVLARKIGAPDSPEFAIGSVAESGEIFVRVPELSVPPRYLEREADRQLSVLHERRRIYTPGRPPADPAGRVVIVVDDGVATGSTLVAALRFVRAKGPRWLVAATAVAPRSTVTRLAREADEVVCLATPEPFFAVGRFFDDFAEVTEAEVVASLAANRTPVPAET